MMQQPGMGEQILRQYPFVDVAFGTHNLYRFAQLMLQAVKTRRRVVEVVQDDEGSIPEELPVLRNNPYHAYITIMYGCNNFCSYCIVPYVRGRERSRASSRIIAEARQLYADGVKEIMLLGQNVNSYGLDVVGEMSFAQLLAALDEIGIERIRFMTSHPKDISDELIDVMANSKHICHSLHLPVQHGNNRILQSMNRRYTREKYLERVAAIRAKVPDISLTTDLIVGYPGETEEEFEDICSLVKEVGYDSAFTFIYSPREGTPAAKMEDPISAAEKSAWFTELCKVQEEIAARRCAKMVGSTVKVLCEQRSDKGIVSGRTEGNLVITFPAEETVVGSFAEVKITSARNWTLQGELVKMY
jgi:tRNA-2-methylthio-N6-dimethylallyladenosine synthase